MKYLLIGLSLLAPQMLFAQTACQSSVENIFKYYAVPEMAKDRSKLSQSNIGFDLEKYNEPLPVFSLSKVPFAYDKTFYHTSIRGEVKSEQKVYQVKITDKKVMAKDGPADEVNYFAQYDQDTCKFKGLMVSSGSENLLMDADCKITDGKSIALLNRADAVCAAARKEDVQTASTKAAAPAKSVPAAKGRGSRGSK